MGSWPLVKEAIRLAEKERAIEIARWKVGWTIAWTAKHPGRGAAVRDNEQPDFVHGLSIFW